MNKLNIAVLFGGCSPEYEISLNSAAAVIDQLDRQKYNLFLLGISREGDWYRYLGGTDDIRADRWLQSGNCRRASILPSRDIHGILEWSAEGIRSLRIDAALPVLHGENGEDGTVQGLLQLAGIPCAGCGVLASAAGMDKDVAHQLAAGAGIPVPRSAVLFRNSGSVTEAAQGLRYPLFVKPAAGSSFGITLVREESGLSAAASLAFLYGKKILLEEAIPGFEVGCAILGNKELVIGEVDEIELKGGFFDFQNKYVEHTAVIHLPARISREDAARVQQTAAAVYRALGCRGFARIDLFLTPSREVVFHEINTLPGFTPQSRFPKMLAEAGYSAGEVLDRIISLALEVS